MLRYQDYWCGKQIIAPAAARHCSVINCQVPGTRSCRGFDSCRLANVFTSKICGIYFFLFWGLADSTTFMDINEE